MRRFKSIGLVVTTALFMTFASAVAQMGGGNMNGRNGNQNRGGQHHGGMNDNKTFGGRHGQGGWCVNPDSLTDITVTGTVIIADSVRTARYFLDTDGDSLANYHLNFGPVWYTQDSSAAVRPQAGDVVTITGGAHESPRFDFDVIVVYEINGEFWRDPFAPLWNDTGRGVHRGRLGNHGWHFGRRADSLATVTLSGTVLVDSTLMAHYFLDSNSDSIPDYFLNFGPWWYQPASGALRPADGDTISVIGGLFDPIGDRLPVLIVYELNGLVWRDSTLVGGRIGGWIGSRNGGRVRSMFDKDDWMEFRAGWGNGHPGGGMRMPDSIFCQLWEVLPENVPPVSDGHSVAAYQIDMYAPDGSDMMNRNGHRGHLNFANNVTLQLHYSDDQIEAFGGDESKLVAQYWNDETNTWAAADAVFDAENNTVTFASTDVSSFVTLATTQTATTVAGDATPVDFTLEQNYPNPFNPKTTINFSLANETTVQLKVYNVVGQHVTTLVDGNLTAGAHQAVWDAADMTSGVYFYELRIGNQNVLKKMNLVK